MTSVSLIFVFLPINKVKAVTTTITSQQQEEFLQAEQEAYDAMVAKYENNNKIICDQKIQCN